MSFEFRITTRLVRQNPEISPNVMYAGFIPELLELLEASDRAIQESLEQAEPVMHPKLRHSELDAIAPARRYRRSMAGGDSSPTCTICLNEFKPNRRVRRLPCGHLFCSVCISEWTCDSNACCPTCREPLVSPMG